MMTNSALICAGQGAPEAQMSVVSVWAALQSSLFSYSFSCKEAGALSSVFPGRFLVQLLLRDLGVAAETAGLALLSPVLHLRIFGHDSSSRSGAEQSNQIPHWGRGCWIQGIRSSPIVGFFWTRSVQKCQAGCCGTGLPVLAALAELSPVSAAALLRWGRDRISVLCSSHRRGARCCCGLCSLGGESLTMLWLHCSQDSHQAIVGPWILPGPAKFPVLAHRTVGKLIDFCLKGMLLEGWFNQRLGRSSVFSH